MAPKLTFQPATPDRWADVARLFGPRGACAGCWCMWPRLPSAAFKAGSGDGNRRALQSLVRRGERPGILAYAGDEPVGWCALAPREAYRARFERSKVFAPVDDQPVWSVVCFFVAKEWRGQGVTVALLNEAARFAAANGARIVEGYPTDIAGGKRSAAAFVWTGLKATFDRAGFREAARPTPTRPTMRKAVRPARTAAAESTARVARAKKSTRSRG